VDEVPDPEPDVANNIWDKFCGNCNGVKQLYIINKFHTHRNVVTVSIVTLFFMCFFVCFSLSIY